MEITALKDMGNNYTVVSIVSDREDDYITEVLSHEKRIMFIGDKSISIVLCVKGNEEIDFLIDKLQSLKQ